MNEFVNRSTNQTNRERILAAIANPEIPDDALLETECCYCQWGEIRKKKQAVFRDMPVVFWTAFCCVCGTQIDEDAFIR
ncbi:MAG: hypothetical protein HY646_19010 [Acidobacteria bacterium]|nr:hypothetical protein [Acidobacteriota bacterium]